MLIQYLSLSNERKKLYFKTNKDFFQLLRPSDNLDIEVNDILMHFAKVNPDIKLLVECSDFTKIERTQEKRNKTIRQFIEILTEIQKGVEVRKISSSMSYLTENLKNYYLWNRIKIAKGEDIDYRSKKLMFQFNNGKKHQNIYNPDFFKGGIINDFQENSKIKAFESLDIYGNNYANDEFTLFLMLNRLFRDKTEIKFHLEKQSFFNAPFLDLHKHLKKFDLIVALPILYSYNNKDRKKMKKIQNLLTIKVGDISDFKDFVFSFLLSSMNEDGVLNMIVPYSFLTTGKNDIRKYLVENDMLLHVENLPMNVLTGKSVDAAFISVYKTKSSEMKGKIAFRAGREGRVRLIPNQKIIDNNFNFSVAQYVSYTPILSNENLNDILNKLDRINSQISSRIYDIKSSIRED